MAILCTLKKTSNRDCRRGLNEDTDLSRKDALSGKDAGVINSSEVTVADVACTESELPRSGVTNADRACKSLWVLDGVTKHDRCRASSLETKHAWKLGRGAAFEFFAVAAEVCGVVTCVTHGNKVEVRCILKNFNDFIRCGLLTFNAVRV
ncbi:MAG: hypothetical protein RLZZ52_1258, partial [Actinomycetota bacterium]